MSIIKWKTSEVNGISKGSCYQDPIIKILVQKLGNHIVFYLISCAIIINYIKTNLVKKEK